MDVRHNLKPEMDAASPVKVVSPGIVDDLLEETTYELRQLTEQLSDLETNLQDSSADLTNSVYIGHEVSKKLLQIVQESPEKTEAAAYAFLHWFKSSGIDCCKLPLNESQIHEYHPLHPLNTSSSDSQDTQWIIWQKLCSLFQQKWVECMLKLALPKVDIASSRTMFQYYIDCLSVLYDSNGVWHLYQRVRRQNIIELVSQHQLNTSNLGDTSLLQLFNTIVTAIISDAEIFAGTTHFDQIVTVEDIAGVYVDAITEHIDLLLKDLQSNTQQCDSIQSSMYRLHKSMANSPKCKVVLLSPSEETGSTESMLPRVVLHEVGAMIVNCWKLEMCIRTAIDSFVSGITPKNVDVCRSIMKGFKGTANSSSVLFQSVDHKPSKTGEAVIMPNVDSPQKIGNWHWRFSFSSYASDLTQLVDEMIRTVTFSSLEQECVLVQQTQPLESIDVCEALKDFNNSLPRKVSVAVAAFIETADGLLPMIMACEEELAPVRNAFIVAVKQYSIEVLNHLLRLSQEVLHTQKCCNLYLLISSTAFLSRKMDYYNSIFHDVNSRAFQCETDQIEELLETLVQQTVVNHKTHLSTAILHDKESNNWSCTKPFFEDEKVSFVVQMWKLHMLALKKDLWAILPPSLAHQVMIVVLEYSVSLFARRYSLVKPSYARVRQLRTDITAILLCTSELFLSLNPERENIERFGAQFESLHENCSSLLAILAIVTSPLNMLYKVYKKGFPPKSHVTHNGETSYNPKTAWLQIYQQELLLPSIMDSNHGPTSNAVAAHLEILCAQPAPVWPLVVKLLIMRDFTLPLMIVTHCLEPPEKFTNQCSWTSCEKLGCEKTALCKQVPEESVWLVVTTLLLHCQSCPEGLSRVLIHLFERFDLWSVVCASSKVYVQFPKWYLPILEELEPVCIRILKSALERVCVSACWDKKQVEEVNVYLPATSLQRTVAAAVKSMTDNLQEVAIMLSTLSRPILFFFANIEAALPRSYHEQEGLRPIIIQVIVTCIYSLLTSPSKIEQLIGKPPRTNELQTLKCVADQFLQAVAELSSDKSHPHSRNLEKLKEMLERLRHEKCTILDESVTGNEQTFHILATEIIGNIQGCEAIVDFYKMLLVNRTWILANLGLDLPTNIHDVEPTLHFNEDFQWPNKHTSSIFEQHNNFGLFCRDHAAVIGFQYDWSSLLQSNLGLTELSFRFLIANRWEMQENVQLEESEVKPVQMLQAQFGFDANGML